MMKRRFRADARKWEAGELTLAEFKSRHPGRDVDGLTQLRDQLAAFGDVETTDPGRSWPTLRDRLPERRSNVGRLRPRIRRPLVAAIAAAVLAGTTVAYAAGVEPVQRVVDGIVDKVAGLFGEQGTANERDDGSLNQNDGERGKVDRRGQDTDEVDHGSRGNQGEIDQPDHGTQEDADQPDQGESGGRGGVGEAGEGDADQPAQGDQGGDQRGQGSGAQGENGGQGDN